MNKQLWELACPLVFTVTVVVMLGATILPVFNPSLLGLGIALLSFDMWCWGKFKSQQ